MGSVSDDWVYWHLFTNASFLPLGATAQGELWPPEQSASILLYSETVWFLNN
jgi:hypothetical protein